jgi:hypothetical protein
MADAKGGNFGTLSWGMGLDTKDFKKKMKDIRKNTKKFGQEMTDQFKTIAKGGAINSLGATQADIAALELGADRFGVKNKALIDRMREIGGIEAFSQAAEDVKNAGNEVDQLNKAMELFGNQGGKILPVLQQGAAGIAAMKAEALELGTALSPQQVAENNVVWTIWEDTLFSIQGLGKQIGLQFSESFGTMAAGVRGFVTVFRKDILLGTRFVADKMKDFIMRAINIFMKFGIPFINSFINFAGQIGGAFQTLFDFLSPATDSAIGGLVSMFNSVTDFIATFKQSLIIGITKPIQAVVRGAFGLLQKLFLGMRDMLAPILFGLVEVGAISDKTAQGLVNQFGDLATELHLQGIKIAKPFADAQKQAEKDMERILTDKYKKDQKQQTRFKGIIGEFTTNFGKALDNAAKVPAKVVAAALEASVSEKFSGLALSGSQEEASLKNTSKNRERFEKDNIKQLIDLNRNFEKLEAI